jgi:hypothetical protein
MNASFGFGKSIGVFARKKHRGAFDAGGFPWRTSFTSIFHPRDSAQRWYMRMSMLAQSQDSVPPALH